MKVIAKMSKLQTRFLLGKGWWFNSTKDYYRLADKIVKQFSKYDLISKERQLWIILEIIPMSHLLRKQSEMDFFWGKLEKKEQMHFLWVLESSYSSELPLPSNIDSSMLIGFKRRSMEERLVSKGF